MRGSAFVKIRVWLVNRDGSINKRSAEIHYGHSSVGDMNTNYQREDAFNRAKNQAIKHYRNEHGIDSDTEINYHLLASGIVNKLQIRGKQVRNIKSLRISPQRKRKLHRTESFLGKQKALKQSDIDRELYEEEYEGKTMKNKIETNKYIIDTGNIKKSRKSKK